jgi:SOS-response transcriptional repressor LexA
MTKKAKAQENGRSSEYRQFAARLKKLRERAYYLWKDERLAGTSKTAFEYVRERGFTNGPDTYDSYEHGKRKAKVAAAEQLIRAYNVPDASVSWLLYGENEPAWGRIPVEALPAEPPPAVIIHLPRLTSTEATEMPEGFDAVLERARITGRIEPVILTPGRKFGAHSFVLRIEDDSMVSKNPLEPHKFPPGDFVTIDPSEHYEPGDFVCAHMEGEPRTIFRRYEEGSSRDVDYKLVPLNSSYRTEEVSQDNPGRIIGRMIEHTVNYRR